MTWGLGQPTPRRWPFPRTPSSSPGVGAGSGQLVVARIIRVLGPGGGMFVYSTPTIQLGSLISTVGISTAGVDPGGNNYLQGDTQYTGGVPGVSHATFALEFFGGGLTSLGWTGATWLPTAEVAFSATGGNITIHSFAGGTVTIDNGAWTTLGTLTNYAVSRGRYRLTPLGELEVDVNVTAGGANLTTQTFSVTLPVAARPTSNYVVAVGQNAVQATGNTWPRMNVNSSGTIDIVNQASSTNQVEAVVTIPLN